MEITGYIIVALAISSVSFSAGLNSSIFRCIEWPETIRTAFFFTLLNSAMTGLGWLIGHAIKGLSPSLAIPLALLMIIFIGSRMMLEIRRKSAEHRILISKDIRIMLAFSLMISINSFLIGLGLGLLSWNILYMLLMLSGAVFFMTIAGIRAGKYGAMNMGRNVEFSGGLVLIIVSVYIFLLYFKIF